VRVLDPVWDSSLDSYLTIEPKQTTEEELAGVKTVEGKTPWKKREKCGGAEAGL